MNSKFKMNLSFGVIAFFMFFFIAYEVNIFMFSYEKEKRNRYAFNKKIFENISKDHEESVAMLAATLSVDMVIKEAYKKDDPELIKEHIMPVWDILKEKKLIHEIHFFKPPAISFVNFSNFNSIGHDVSDVRKDIEWVTQSFSPSKHIMFCKTYAGYRATYPIVDENNKMLGGVSMGKKIDWLPSIMKERTGDDSFLVYTKSAASSLGKKYHEAFMSDKESFENLILGEKTLSVNVNDLKSLNIDKEISKITINDENYIVNRYIIRDFNNNIMGYLFSVNNFDYYFSGVLNRVLRGFLIMLFAVLVIYILMARKIKSMLAQAQLISNITKKIKERDFSVLRENHDASLYKDEDILTKVKDDVLEMGVTIEKKYTDLEEQLVTQLYKDDLTGLGNRNALMYDMSHCTHKRALVLFNIQSFKQINDVFGFEYGNHILQNLGSELVEFIRDSKERVYRVGGDEFAMLLIDYDDDEVKRYIKIVLQEIGTRSIEINAHTSTRLNLYAGVCLEEEEQLVKADMALTKAKHEKLEYAIYSENSDTKAKQVENIETQKIIYDSIHNKKVLVFYQGIVKSDSKEICKYEALVRLENSGKILTPNLFLDVSMQTKSYHDISRSVISQAFATIQKMNIAISINLNAIDIKNAQTLELIFTQLEAISNRANVIFELTETDSLYESSETYEFIKRVKGFGAKIAIDDFGTGYSNFAYLMKIEPDYLKIDGSLIKNIDIDKNAHNIVKTIVGFAKELKIKTIAEYVHNESVSSVCFELGVDEFQGFHYAQPKKL